MCQGQVVPVLKKKPELKAKLLSLVADSLAGEPQSDKRWVCQSLSKLQKHLAEHEQEHISRTSLARLLHEEKIRPKSNVKRLQAKEHPDRDRQFLYLQQQRQAFELAGWPCISVDTKKKELLGLFAKPGKTWCQQATAVYSHDFPSYAEGRVIPYGIYDPSKNVGYVAVGQSADTPEFAVDSMLWWWQNYAKEHYQDAPELLILADGGGSNGHRPRRFKQQLQEKLADALGLSVTVCHYPTGASKWNPIEHRLFSQISATWAATPLTSYELVLDAIRSTTTQTGLKVHATHFDTVYQKGLSVADDDFKALLIDRHDTCPQWNYTIRPRSKSGK